jgi:hypothetical protein
VLSFLSKKTQNYFIPNPSDSSFETLKNYNKNCNMDVFFALSHGVHRGILKSGKYDDRAVFVKKLIDQTKNVKFDIYGIDKVQPIWADHYFKTISNSKMGLNLSRGLPTRHYSSNRIASLMGNGLLTFVDKKTQLNDMFSKNEIVMYENINDLTNKINFYKKNDHLRSKIAAAGRKKYFKLFNELKTTKYIVDKSLGKDVHLY